MKFSASILGLLLSLSGLAFAQAPAAAGGAIRLTKITRNLVATPEFTYSGAETFRTNSSDRWLAIDAEFSSTAEFTDEVTLKYYILIDGKLLTGEVTHVIILAGKELHSGTYGPPPPPAAPLAHPPPPGNPGPRALACASRSCRCRSGVWPTSLSRRHRVSEGRGLSRPRRPSGSVWWARPLYGWKGGVRPTPP